MTLSMEKSWKVWLLIWKIKGLSCTVYKIDGYFSRKAQYFPTTHVFYTPADGGSHWNLVSAQRVKKTRMMVLPDGLKTFQDRFRHLDTIPACDRQMSSHLLTAKTALTHSIVRVKMLITYQFKSHCKGDSYNCKTANIILRRHLIKYRCTSEIRLKFSEITFRHSQIRFDDWDIGQNCECFPHLSGPYSKCYHYECSNVGLKKTKTVGHQASTITSGVSGAVC